MANIAGRGRNRASRSFIRTSREFAAGLPVLAGDETSIAAFIAYVTAGVAKEQVDPRTADTLLTGARIQAQGLKDKRNREEVAELKALLAEAKEVALVGVQREVADHQHVTVSDITGYTKPEAAR